MRYHKIELFCKQFIVDPDDSLELTKWGHYEPYESSIIAEAVKGKVCLDVGAHIGYVSILMAASGAKEVHAFEPNPLNFAFLEINAQPYGDVIKRYNHALIETTTNPISSENLQIRMKPMYLCAVNSGDDLFYPSGASDQVTVIVKTGSYDEIWASRNRLYPTSHYGAFDFCKIDVQGTELNVLKGMEREIGRGKPMTIALEYYGDGMWAAGIDGKDVLRFLWKHGFSLQEIREGEKRLVPIESEAFAEREDLQRGYTNILASRG